MSYDYSINKVISQNTKVKRKKSAVAKEIQVKRENGDLGRYHLNNHVVKDVK